MKVQQREEEGGPGARPTQKHNVFTWTAKCCSYMTWPQESSVVHRTVGYVCFLVSNSYCVKLRFQHSICITPADLPAASAAYCCWRLAQTQQVQSSNSQTLDRTQSSSATKAGCSIRVEQKTWRQPAGHIKYRQVTYILLLIHVCVLKILQCHKEF